MTLYSGELRRAKSSKLTTVPIWEGEPPNALHLLPDGRVFSDRAAQKIRNSERGWKYAAAQLEAFGATDVPTDASARTEWLNSSLQLLATRVRHKGNHKYAWPLNVAIRRQLPASLPYPKSLDPIYTAL